MSVEIRVEQRLSRTGGKVRDCRRGEKYSVGRYWGRLPYPVSRSL